MQENMCVSMEKCYNIVHYIQIILKTQRHLELRLFSKKQYLQLFSYKINLKCSFYYLLIPIFFFCYNILYNNYIISNTKINKINLVILIY